MAGTDVRGLFLNVLPVRVVVDDRSWVDLVRDLHDQEVAMTPHRRVPFAVLAQYMRNPRLDANFTFNKFHALGTLGANSAVVDSRIGCEPTIRREPNHFGLSVGFVQDPASDRSLLMVDHASETNPAAGAHRYVEAFTAAAEAMTRLPEARCRAHPPVRRRAHANQELRKGHVPR